MSASGRQARIRAAGGIEDDRREEDDQTGRILGPTFWANNPIHPRNPRRYRCGRVMRRTASSVSVRKAQSVTFFLTLLLFLITRPAMAALTNGTASWYGEDHRGRLMANGKRFNPDRLTAASWFYPLGSKVRVTVAEPNKPRRRVLVTITDRGPSKDLVRDGRIIDLTHAAFRQLARPNLGLISVSVEQIE